MIIGVLKETQKGDNRVAITPKIAQQLIERGFDVRIEEDAGVNSSYKNSDYSKAGASIRAKEDLLSNADVLIKINPFDNSELEQLKPGQII
ncbi:MAG: NAD(P)(+) transhydrogenase (Re/Si-specific) subunit alpha, partial [Flavobacteriia bacterium]|nr:NAD(P)(+) transhydrogenase (Re/Si-specific) subunit alpha [Flavobacteriia bacterium]